PDDTAELAAAARRQPHRLPVPRAGVSVRGTLTEMRSRFSGFSVLGSVLGSRFWVRSAWSAKRTRHSEPGTKNPEPNRERRTQNLEPKPGGCYENPIDHRRRRGNVL